MKIAVMGAGGIGGYVGGRLAESGHEVHFVARGRHLEALQSGGLHIESPHGDVALADISATSDPAAIGIADLILFTVKMADSDAAAEALAPLIGAQTRIVTLQNGIDSKDIIGRHVDRDRVACGIIYLAAYIKRPGLIFNPGGIHRMVVDRLAGDPVMQQFFAACDQARGINAEPTDQPDHTLWGKFIALVAFSGVTCLTRLPIGAVYEHPEILAFMRQLLTENVQIAQRMGLDFDNAHADRTVALFADQPYQQKSSMLVDLEAGKPLELRWLSGRIHGLGRELGIPTPANSAVWAALVAYADGPPAPGDAGPVRQN